MADNIELNAGSGGATMATDDDATAHHQYVKVEYGPDNTQTKVTATDGLPIQGDGTDLKVTLDSEAVVLGAGTAEIGKLAAGAAAIGSVTANAGTNLNTSALLTTTAHDAAFGTAGTADAQVRTVQGVASMTPILVNATGQGDVPITLDGEAVVLGAGTAEIGKLAAGSASIGTLGANSGTDIGDVDVTSISAGANLVGDVGISGARTSGGTSIFRSIDLDEGTLEIVKASAGQLYWIHAMNLAATVRFVKIYNAASGTIGTGTPVLTFPIATQGDTNGAGFVFSVPNGVAFSTGITIGASTGVADADTGAPGANEVIVNVGFA